MEGEGTALERLRSFVEDERRGRVSATIRCQIVAPEDELQGLTVILKRLIIEERCTRTELTLTFRVRDELLQVFHMLVACPTLTDLYLRLVLAVTAETAMQRARSEHDISSLAMQLLSVVSTSRSLSTVGITFTLEKVIWGNLLGNLIGARRHIIKSLSSTLVRYNPPFPILTLQLEDIDGMKIVTYSFSRDSTVKTCSLTTWRFHGRYQRTYNHDCTPLQTTLNLVTTIGLKELLLRSMSSSDHGHRCPDCQEEMARFVEQNNTLEKLNLIGTENLFCSDRLELMVRALRRNKTLKELGYECTAPEFKLLVRVFRHDHQKNCSLCTLKVYLAGLCSRMLDCMTALGKLLRSNTTLKHVQLSDQGSCLFNTPPILDVSEAGKVKESRIRDKLERILNKDLRRNTCLQTLRVGLWRLVRVGGGDEWEMGYEGPCLQLVPRKEYVVKVLMR